jgi:TonB family protein
MTGRWGVAVIAIMGSAAQAVAPLPGTANAAMMLHYYPHQSLARGESGTVGFRLTVDRRGRPMRCAVTASSGFGALDVATCDMLVETATLSAKAGGKTVPPGARDGHVNWRLPPGYTAVALAVPTPGLRLPAPLICRVAPKVGSLVRQQRVCMTEAQWINEYRAVDSNVESMSMVGGPLVTKGER